MMQLAQNHLPDTPPSSMESTVSRFRHCLICGVQTANSHMGIDSCRACAVFYKRTLTGTRPLKCKQGGGNCLLSDPTTSCRKCRFERFSGIIQRAYGAARRPQMEQTELVQEDYHMSEEPEEPQEDEQEPLDIKDVKLLTMPSTSFIDHTKYFELETASGAPLLERIRKGYSIFCMMRKLGETSMQPGSFCKEAGFKRDQLYQKFIPATYSNTLKYGRVYVESLLDFAHSAFDDFRTLSIQEKKVFMKNAFNLVGAVAGAYRAFHHFPHDETVFISYTTTLTYETAAYFWDDSPSETNKDAATRTLREGMRKGNRMKKEGFRRVMPTEDEFIALIGLAFWTTDSAELDLHCDSTLTQLATKNRQLIMREMHQSYWREGRTDYAARIGELFCLLVSIQRSVSMLNEEIQLYRLLDVFDESLFKKECGCGETHDK
ncbi:hypothetical protein PENTCL1PPCAC_14366 [Pristionchus entomophagus]|uniref:Nuclear receptor n=1 Tax=Pristionchus entomophagus TaxID=358040 RepID=A0AAV5T9F9_9BILA|nr:hypothetical protein PENTCL1PPCAC_14366 [Pristionchus entomophagus]